MEYKTIFLDVAALWAIFFAGAVGASGIFFRHSGLKGLIIGLIAGTVLIAITPLVTPTVYTGFHINPEKSFVLGPLSSFVAKILKTISPG